MTLETFGSILNFAEELEEQDRRFYEAAAGNPACAAQRELFADLAAGAVQNARTVQRIRRENVTEMILEPVAGFAREPFCEACEGAAVLGADEVLATARRLERRAAAYYREAAQKLKALTEVSRALERLARNRESRLGRLESRGA